MIYDYETPTVPQILLCIILFSAWAYTEQDIIGYSLASYIAWMFIQYAIARGIIGILILIGIVSLAYYSLTT